MSNPLVTESSTLGLMMANVKEGDDSDNDEEERVLCQLTAKAAPDIYREASNARHFFHHRNGQ